MRMLLALWLLSVTLSPPFVTAEARATSVGADGMVLEVYVEISDSALVVLARGVGRFDELAPVALTQLGEGRWGGIVEIPIIEDIRLGFEIIRPDGGSAVVSDLHLLSELGVDPAVFGVGQPTTTLAPSAGQEPGSGDPSTAPIWLGVGAGASALALLLVWWLWGDRSDDEGRDDDSVDGDTGAIPDVS
jgi:hypothetical protein